MFNRTIWRDRAMTYDQDDFDEYREEMYDHYEPTDEDDDGEYGLSAAERNK